MPSPRDSDVSPAAPALRFVAGRNPVRDLLADAPERVEKVVLQSGAHGSAIDAVRRLAKAAGVTVQTAPSPRLDKLAPGMAHQGVVAVVSPVAYLDLDTMLSAIAPTLDEVREQKPVVIVLDEVEDPHNFGAILRSAVAAGAAGAVVPERRMAPLSTVAVKASAGTALRLPIARVGRLADALEQMKERGYWIVGLAGDGDGTQEKTTVWAYDWDRAVAIVVGNEGRGLRPVVRAACDVLAEIPLRGPAESLNASVAAGVALFAATRERA